MFEQEYNKHSTNCKINETDMLKLKLKAWYYFVACTEMSSVGRQINNIKWKIILLR